MTKPDIFRQYYYTFDLNLLPSPENQELCSSKQNIVGQVKNLICLTCSIVW